MTRERSISIIVPAYNERENIAATLDAILKGCARLNFPYEIIVVNDASHDLTGEIAESYANKHRQIRVLQNPSNLGFGGSYRQGVLAAKMNYVVLVCGDDSLGSQSLYEIVSRTGETDILVTYVTNPKIRNFKRRLISRTYVFLINLLFNLRLRYYNGHNVFPTRVLQNMTFTGGFAFSTQIIVRLIKAGATHREVPLEIKDRQSGESKAFHPKSFISVGKALFELFLEVYFSRTLMAQWTAQLKSPN